MAPQQNSTLIDDNMAMSPSLLNLPEELGRYSPILPPKCNENFQNNNKNNDNKNNNKNNIERTETYDNNRRQKNYKSNRTGSSRGGRSHRSRSVSLYGVNSTVEQGHKEIPIWLDDEPRYVSGVTNKTTCNDIIKALIDDEIRNGNFAYCRRTKDGAASRDYSDYVITESWRGIERSYDGNMAILPVWKAWSRVHNETYEEEAYVYKNGATRKYSMNSGIIMIGRYSGSRIGGRGGNNFSPFQLNYGINDELRLALKHHTRLKDPLDATKPHCGLTAIRKYLSKLLRFAKNTKKHDKKVTERKINKCLVTSQEPIPDEFLFVILPDKCNECPESENLDSNKGNNKNLKPTTEEAAKKAEAKLLKDKLYRLSETRLSTRKRRAASRRASKEKRLNERRRSRCDSSCCIKRRKDVPNRNSIRNQLARKTSEVDQLYDREYILTKQLTSKCKLHKLQNDLYLDAEKQLELSIEQIQRNIETYADEIIKTEHELLELKNEIKQDISIINNLKRMTLEANSNDCGVPLTAPIVPEPTAIVALKESEDQMLFVDNIYEFCDNNASMLV